MAEQQIEKWVTLKDVQSYLGVGRDTILQWIAKRNMPAGFVRAAQQMMLLAMSKSVF